MFPDCSVTYVPGLYPSRPQLRYSCHSPCHFAFGHSPPIADPRSWNPAPQADEVNGFQCLFELAGRVIDKSLPAPG